MRVRVDGSRCQGHTLCAMIAPNSFELDDVDGHAHAATEVVAGENYDAVVEAARSCPEQAIEVVVDPQGRARPERNGAVL
ncbi:ferredoxin [Mycobacterium colombiense]|uniref:ferredoxin n=1 Tax=Mycobacterium colombiense TaxID=339268 RepID=UPI00096DCC21|nr:ferredoxin [Mycobacterium colombiense]OMB92309.1 ferredoxin [Mycobacterium colombiense]